MRTMKLGNSELQVPVVAVGMMHINRLDKKQAEKYLQKCLELGCNFFDHADVYGMDRPDGYGDCERIFAEAVHMKPSVRENLIIQTKCGFAPPLPGERKPEMINGSKEYILKAVDDSLTRLGTDYLDVLLIHAPDALTEPEEIAEAFDILNEKGKVRHFGVSNYNTAQIQLLEQYVRQPLEVDQLMLSVVNSGLISRGMYVNRDEPCAIDRDGGILDYCRLKGRTVQCWGVMQFGYMSGCFLGHPDYAELNRVLDKYAEKYEASASSVAVAWILRHPAHMMPITGTVNSSHLEDNVKGADIELTRSEWYEIWKAAGNFIR